MSTTNASPDEAKEEKCSLASVKRSKVANENLKADTKLKEEKSESKSDESSVNSDVSARNERKRGPCPWQVDPPPQPFKKARHASEIKNYEHTVSRMKLSLGVERERLQAQSSLNPSSNISSSYNNEYIGSSHSSIPSYANIYNNASSNYNANLYNPLLRWSRLAGNNDNLPVNRVLQSILFSGNEQQNTEVHPLLMLSLAEGNNTEENAPCEMSVNNFNCGLLSNMSGAHGGTTPIGMHSPPTSEYDSSSDEASLGDDFIHDQSFMQQQLQYQQLQHYQQLNSQQQNLNELMNQSNANAAVNFCKKLQQIQQNNPNVHENTYLFQNALMNCGGLEGFQNRQLLNLHLQNLCEKVQAQRNLMPFSNYNFPNLNQTHTPDFADDNSSVGGLDSFRRNTPSETGSELTLTAVPLVSNSSGLTDETRSDSRSSASQVDNIKKVTESRLRQDISEESDTDLSLSEDSCSEIGVAEASDSSEQEEESEMSSVKGKKASQVLTPVENRENVVEDVVTAEKTGVVQKESDFSVSQNKGDESLATSPCSESHESGEAQLTTVLTCNCVIAKEQSSPSSVSSTKSIEESLPSSSPPVSDCQDCSFKGSADDKDRHGKTSDSFFFDQPFHISMKQQNIGFQKA